MDLQTVFYIIAIVFMVVIIGVLLTIGLIIFYLRSKIVMLARMAHKPAETAAEVGGQMVASAIKKVDEFMKTKPKKKSTRSSR